MIVLLEYCTVFATLLCILYSTVLDTFEMPLTNLYCIKMNDIHTEMTLKYTSVSQAC